MRKFFKTWRLAVVSLFIVVGIGFLLRVINLTILPVFADEAIYIRWAQVMASEPTLRFLPLSDGKQPFYMWVLMFLVRKMGDPLFAGRMVSAVTGIGTIIGIAASALVVFRSKKVAIASAIIWAISPFSLFFDRMALVDAMLACFGIWTFLLATLTAKTMRTDLAMLTGFALGGALLTKSPALFFVLLLPFVGIVSQFPKNKALHLFKLAALIAIAYLIGFAMYNILRLGPNFHLINSRNADYVYPLTHIFQSPLDPLRPHFDRSLEWLWIWGPSLLLLLIPLGALANIKRSPRQTLLLLAWGVGPIIINAAFAKVFTARYIFFALPYLYILAASVLLTKQKMIQKAGILFGAIWLAHALFIDFQLLTNPWQAPMPRSERSGYLEEWTSGIGIKEVSEFLKEEHAKDPNKQIVVGTEGFFGTLPDGLQIYMEGVPNVIIIGIGLDIGGVHQSLKDSKKTGNKTYLVANSSRLTIKKDFEKYGLRVVKQFRKASRPDFIREYVQHGEYDTFYLFEVQ